MAYGRHFEKSLYRHISAANHPNCTKFNIQTKILPQSTETTTKSEIRKFKMVDVRTIKNHFIGYNSAAC